MGGTVSRARRRMDLRGGRRVVDGIIVFLENAGRPMFLSSQDEATAAPPPREIPKLETRVLCTPNGMGEINGGGYWL